MANVVSGSLCTVPYNDRRLLIESKVVTAPSSPRQSHHDATYEQISSFVRFRVLGAGLQDGELQPQARACAAHSGIRSKAMEMTLVGSTVDVQSVKLSYCSGPSRAALTI